MAFAYPVQEAILYPDSDGESLSLSLCGEGDLNPHVLTDTSPSSWRVYLFRHHRWVSPPQRANGFAT